MFCYLWIKWYCFIGKIGLSLPFILAKYSFESHWQKNHIDLVFSLVWAWLDGSWLIRIVSCWNFIEDFFSVQEISTRKETPEWFFILKSVQEISTCRWAQGEPLVVNKFRKQRRGSIVNNEMNQFNFPYFCGSIATWFGKKELEKDKIKK